MVNFNNIVVDIGVGLFFNSENVYVGLFLKYLNSLDESFFDINENLGVGLLLCIMLYGGW